MRLSIIQKHQREKEAWDANSQLVTSMSHDIRTPLTSMIGYLDIIKSEKYQSAEELERYISSCREKAFQLKELSDKLFQYFLVFNSGENEKHLEVFDANVLLTQILQAGQTLYSLAREYGVSEQVILEYNPEAADGLRTDQPLKIPFRAEAPADSRSERKLRRTFDTPSVSKGETLYAISPVSYTHLVSSLRRFSSMR